MTTKSWFWFIAELRNATRPLGSRHSLLNTKMPVWFFGSFKSCRWNSPYAQQIRKCFFRHGVYRAKKSAKTALSREQQIKNPFWLRFSRDTLFFDASFWKKMVTWRRICAKLQRILHHRSHVNREIHNLPFAFDVAVVQDILRTHFIGEFFLEILERFYGERFPRLRFNWNDLFVFSD